MPTTTMASATEATMTAVDYLKKPYQRCVVPDADGSFRAEIVEFPGCLATGDTAAEAFTKLEDVAVSWLEGALAKGLRIPEPLDDAGFSGKLMLRLPKTLHRKAAHAAARDGVSLNQFIVAGIAEQVGSAAARWQINQPVLSGVAIQAVQLMPMYSGQLMPITFSPGQRYIRQPFEYNAATGVYSKTPPLEQHDARG